MLIKVAYNLEVTPTEFEHLVWFARFMGYIGTDDTVVEVLIKNHGVVAIVRAGEVKTNGVPTIIGGGTVPNMIYRGSDPRLAQYVEKKIMVRVAGICRKCETPIDHSKQKYCGNGSNKDDEHKWMDWPDQDFFLVWLGVERWVRFPMADFVTLNR